MSNFIDEIMDFNPSNLEVFNEPVKANYDQNVYKTNPANSKSEDGHYRSKLRVVYNPNNIKRSIVDQATYAMKDADGFFIVRSSLSEGNKECPIFKSWKKLWFSGDEVKKNWARAMYEKTESRWVMVQILEDDNQPELVGQFKAMKLPKAIFDKMTAKMNPNPESKKTPVAIMDYLIGLPLEMDVEPGPDDPSNPSRKQREIKYTLCDFDADYAPIIKVDGTPLFSDTELELIDQYNTAVTEILKKKSNAKVEAAMKKKESMANDIRALYQKAMDYVKENSFDLKDECGFKPWDENISVRVQNWIDVVAAMQDPAVTTVNELKTGNTRVVPEASNETIEDPFAEMMNQTTAPAATEEDSDLPF